MIEPFCALRFDPERAGDIGSVVAPPYDVIDAAARDALHARSPYNVVRLILSREADPYLGAARTLERWVAEGILVEERAPAFFVSEERFVIDGEQRIRHGLLGRLRLEGFATGRVLPHERTLPEAKADRLALLRTCRTNLSPIFLLFSRPGWSLCEALGDAPRAVVADFTDDAGVARRLSRITDPGVCARLRSLLGDRPLFIADGHHRYETALRYRDEMRAATGRSSGGEPYDFVLAYLTNMEEPGLAILPTHRIVRGLAPRVLGDLGRRLAARFPGVERRVIGAAEIGAALRGGARGEHRAAVAAGGALWLLRWRLEEVEGLPEVAASSSAQRHLDVVLLHRVVLRGLLGVDEHVAAAEGRLQYTHRVAEALAGVERDSTAVALLLNPPSVEDLRAVCLAGEMMPEKSTYFFPKLPTGLVFHRLGEIPGLRTAG